MSRLPGGRLRPEHQYDLMLRAALGPIEQAADALTRWRNLESLDDPGIGVQRVLPLLADRVTLLAPDDAVLRRRVLHVTRFAWLRGTTLLSHTAPAVAQLQDAGIPVLLIKGAALIQVPGIERRSRMMDDLDLLVAPEHVEEAARLLFAAGFHSPYGVLSAAEVRETMLHTHGLQLSDGHGGELDLHWHALHAHRHPDADRDWWSAAVPATLLGVATRAASSADVLVQSVAHGSRWVERAAPRWAPDLSMLLAADPALDWDRVVERARATRLSPVVADALDYVEDVTGLAPPAEARAALRRAPVPVAERLRARRPIDPADGGPRPPGRFGRLAEAYEERIVAAAPPGARTGPTDGARMLAEEWWLPSSRAVPAQAAFLAARRPWPMRRLARRAVGVPSRPVVGRPAYEIGRRIRFGRDDDGLAFLGGGWHAPEDWGSWSRGTPSYVVLPLADPIDRDLQILLQLKGFTTDYLPPMVVDVAVNDVRIAAPRFADPATPTVLVHADIPAAALRGWNRLELTFVARHPVTPAEGRYVGDERRIAVGLVELVT